jgi:hypothetical protein
MAQRDGRHAVLDRVRDEDGEPIFLLKGGVAMELRLQLRARVTRDYDSAFRARAEELFDHLDEALAQEWNNFTVTRDAPEPIKNTRAVRVRMRLSYKGRSWGSVKVELTPVEGDMGTELDRVAGVHMDALQVPVPETRARRRAARPALGRFEHFRRCRCCLRRSVLDAASVEPSVPRRTVSSCRGGD